MSIGNFISSHLNQTCVYWANPVDNGFGGLSYDEPVELPCRWEDTQQVIGTITGNQIIGFQNMSRALAFLDQDVDLDGILMLGTLDDLNDSEGDSDGDYADPKKRDDTFIIKRFKKTPALHSTTEFIRIAYLSPYLS